MIDLIERRDMIRDRFVSYVENDLTVAVAIVGADNWVAVDPPYRMYGYLLPERQDDEVVIPFCPDVMAAHTLYLTEEALSGYLDLVEFVLARHVQYFDDDRTVDERRYAIENEVSELNKDALTFLSSVEAAAFDMLLEGDDDDDDE